MSNKQAFEQYCRQERNANIGMIISVALFFIASLLVVAMAAA